MNHYDRLRVPRDATAAEIRDAYRREAREAHPDRNPGSEARMAAINEAYRVLGDPVRRRRYDDETRPAPADAARSQTGGGPAVREEELRRAVVDTTPARFPWKFMAFIGALGMAIIVLGLILAEPAQTPAPDNILRSADCVSIGTDLAATEVLCSGPHDAVVHVLVPFGDTCPSGTDGYRDRQGMGTACVVLGTTSP